MKNLASLVVVATFALGSVAWADKYDPAPLHHAQKLLQDARNEVHKKLEETKNEAPEHLKKCEESIDAALAKVDESIKWFEHHFKEKNK
jgi:hypothetical protein